MEVTNKAQRSHLPRNPLKLNEEAGSGQALDTGVGSRKSSKESTGTASRKSSKEQPWSRRGSKDKDATAATGTARTAGPRRAVAKMCSQEDEFTNRDNVLKLVRKDGWALAKAPWFCGDREIVIEAVSCSGGALTYATDELKADREVILNAILSNPWALADASQELKGDKKLAMQAVRVDGLTLAHASLQLRKDADVVLEAIAQDGAALAYAGDNLRESEYFILEALEINWAAFQAAPRDLRSSAVFVQDAVAQIDNCHILAWADERLRGDKQFMSSMILKDGQALQYGSRVIREDIRLVIQAVQQDPQSLVHASVKLRDNPKVVLEAVCRDGMALVHASKAMKANRTVVLTAVSQNRKATEYVSKLELLRDPELVEIVTSEVTPDLSRMGTPMPGSRPGSRLSIPSREDSGTPNSGITDETVFAAYGEVLGGVLRNLRNTRKSHGLPTIRAPQLADDAGSDTNPHHRGPIVKESADSLMARMWNQGNQGRRASVATLSQAPSFEDKNDAKSEDDATDAKGEAQDEDKVVASFNTSWQAGS